MLLFQGEESQFPNVPLPFVTGGELAQALAIEQAPIAKLRHRAVSTVFILTVSFYMWQGRLICQLW